MSLSGTNLLKVKDYNVAVVLNLIRKYEPISRREIADRTGLSFQTVTNITHSLLQSGVIQEGLELRGNGVRQSRSVQINPNADYAVGIHIDRAIRETGISKEQLLGLGLALPGPLDIEAGCLLNVPNLNDWANHPIRDELEELLHLPVLLEADVSAIVLGEQWCGWGTEYHNVLYLYVGIGIGLGIVSNGHALRGWKGNIGQIGHVQVDPAGPLGHCGKRGCLQAYCTADAILRD